MAERRSLGDAMEMTPAKLAFIKGEPASQANASSAESSPATSTNEQTIELELPTAIAEQPKVRAKGSRRSSRGRSPEGAPEASEILDQVLVPVTIRLQRRVAQALRRAYLEQRLRHAKPDTQQEIVEEAIADWLAEHHFLE
jgi:hypothetical protein